MRKTLLALIPVLCLFACKKVTEEIIEVVPAATSATVDLKIDQVINDSTIVLKWAKYTGKHFAGYRLRRVATYLKGDQFGSFFTEIDSSTDVNDLTFTERDMPLASQVSYYLYVLTDTLSGWNYPKASEVVHFRKNALVSGVAKDVLIDELQQRLYMIENNKISITDYSGRTIKVRDFPVLLGYCALGDFNGRRELYVPGGDGWLEILDAATLEKIDRIYVGGLAIGSVVTTKGKIFLSSSDQQLGYNDCIKSYDRASKTFIGRTGYWPRTRLVKLEGSNVEIVDVTIDMAPVSMHHYLFSPSGIPIAKKEDPYHGDYRMAPEIVKSFPDGSKLITSASGSIFDKSLVFERYLKSFGAYSDFAFNNTGSVIYASYQTEKKIESVSYPTGEILKTYTTKFYPFKIFRIENKLLCITKPMLGLQSGYMFVEIINL